MTNLKQKTFDALLDQGHLNKDQISLFQMIGFQCFTDDDNSLTSVQLSVAYDSSINFGWDTSHQLSDHTFNLLIEFYWFTQTHYIKIKSNNEDGWTETFYLLVEEQSVEDAIIDIFTMLEQKEPQSRFLKLTQMHPTYFKEFLAGAEKLTKLLESSALQDIFTEKTLNKDVV